MKRLLVTLLLLSAAFFFPQTMNAAASDKQSYKMAEKIEASIDQGQWEQAANQRDQIETWYKKNKWKLQLMGDEQEYENINIDIQKLKSSISQKDATQSKLLLADMKTRFKEIYSF